MKIRYLKNNEIDIDLWDACVRQSLQGFPYAYSFYLNVVAPNYSAIVLNNYEAILPLPTKKKFGIEYVYYPLLCQQLGVISTIKLSKIVVDKMVNTIPAKIKYINYCVSDKLFDGGSFLPKNNYIIHLNQPYSNILANYKYNTRREIKIALKNEPQIVTNIEASAIVALMRQTYNIDSSVLSIKDYTILEKLLNVLTKQKLGVALGVLNKNKELDAVIYCVKTEQRIINLVNASTGFGKKNGWMAVLIDHIIKQHSNTNYVFDFEGSNIPSVAHFFKNFGSEKTVYYNWLWNRLPFPFKYFKPS